MFLSALDEFKENWDAREGKIRLLLPENLLNHHLTLLSLLNDFRDAVKAVDENYDESETRIDVAFECVHVEREALENGLREFLRTEELVA